MTVCRVKNIFLDFYDKVIYYLWGGCVYLTRGEKLRSLRKARGYSQSDLAAALGIDQTTISLYELNRRRMSLDFVFRACSVLEGNPADFLSDIAFDPEILLPIGDLVDNPRKNGAFPLWLENALRDYPGESDLEAVVKIIRERKAEIDGYFSRLNDKGQRAALDYLRYLSTVPEYQAAPENPDKNE